MTDQKTQTQTRAEKIKELADTVHMQTKLHDSGGWMATTYNITVNSQQVEVTIRHTGTTYVNYNPRYEEDKIFKHIENAIQDIQAETSDIDTML
jgi:hypothetical protein